MEKLIVLFIAFFVLQSCNKIQLIMPQTIEILSAEYSGCIENKSVNLIDEYDKMIIRSVNDDHYQIEHYNATFNCCLDKGIEVDVFLRNDTIFYSDYEKETGLCNCICDYNTLAEVGGIQDGEHVVCLISGDQILGTIELNFKNEMYEEVAVSEMN